MSLQSMKGTGLHRCPYCDYEFAQRSDLEGHLLEEHFLDMRSYYELDPGLSNPDHICYKCGKNRVPLTYINNSENFYLPCGGCLGNNKYDKPQSIDTVQRVLKNYYKKIEGDRYLQMFLIDDMFFENTLPHTYLGFKDVLKLIRQKQGIDRNEIWFPDFKLGFPKIIGKENLEGIKIVTIKDRYNIDDKDPRGIRINDWILVGPELVPYDQKGHNRCNILNINSSRNTKRIRLKDQKDQCAKFYNNISDPDVKSIFQLVSGVTGEVIPITDLSQGDQVVLRLILLRHRPFFKTLRCILDEICKGTGVLSDSVFLRNTITVNPDIPLKINLGWTWEKKKENYINISII